MSVYEQVASQIVKDQEAIIGPLAFDQARKVNGIQIDLNGSVKINGNGKQILTDLVKVYSEFFGQASVEVCREAVREVGSEVTKEDLPDILK
jgi:hypothetical protein